MKRFFLLCWAICLLNITGSTNLLLAQTTASDSALNAAYHQFDFWLGEWDVYAYGTEKLVGKSHIMSINDSSGILENYHTPDGRYKGKSLNTYNRKTKQWEQYWIDNSGLVLKLSGEFRDRKMIMLNFDGLKRNKITWQTEAQNVRQTWESSKDGGKTWTTVFDGIYIPLQEP